MSFQYEFNPHGVAQSNFSGRKITLMLRRYAAYAFLTPILICGHERLTERRD